MTVQFVLRFTGRALATAALAVTAIVVADATPAAGSRGGGNDEQDVENAGVPVTVPTTAAPATSTTVTTATTVATATTPDVPESGVTSDPAASPAGGGQDSDPVTTAPDPVPGSVGDPGPAAESAVAEGGRPVPQPRTSLPRTGAGIGDEALLGLGLVGAGLAARAAGRNQRRGTT